MGEAASALRRRRESRRPYAKVYDDQGFPRLLPAESELAGALVAAAEAMIDAVDARARRASTAGERGSPGA